MLAPSRREAIIDHTIGANHNDNKPTYGKTFLREQERCRSDARADQYLSRSLFVAKNNALHIGETLISNDGRI